MFLYVPLNRVSVGLILRNLCNTLKLAENAGHLIDLHSSGSSGLLILHILGRDCWLWTQRLFAV